MTSRRLRRFRAPREIPPAAGVLAGASAGAIDAPPETMASSLAYTGRLQQQPLRAGKPAQCGPVTSPAAGAVMTRARFAARRAAVATFA